MSAAITEGVEFDTIAREWRFKWSPNNDKKSLAEAQQVLNKYTAELKQIKGVTSVQRVVCGGCMDFKVVIAAPIAEYKAWETTEFKPEAQFLDEVGQIDGVDTVETQTYTLMSVL
jgi:hypothetical protein